MVGELWVGVYVCVRVCMCVYMSLCAGGRSSRQTCLRSGCVCVGCPGECVGVGVRVGR